MHNTADLRPLTHFNCNGCRANAHSECERNDLIHIKGNCGETHTLGGCFGVILYPVKNPTKEQHNRFYKTIQAHNAKPAPVLSVVEKVSKTHVIGLHEHDLSGSSTLDSAKAA